MPSANIEREENIKWGFVEGGNHYGVSEKKEGARRGENRVTILGKKEVATQTVKSSKNVWFGGSGGAEFRLR